MLILKNMGYYKKIPVSCVRHTCEEVKKNLEAPKTIKALSNLLVVPPKLADKVLD